MDSASPCPVTLSAADLGLPADSDFCRNLAQELGVPPPWPLAALKSVFDRRYPGWDDPPELAPASPVSRLRGLTGAIGREDEPQTQEDALHELSSEIKNAQIRMMFPRADDSTFQDECNFLLLALEQSGRLLLGERKARRAEEEKAAKSIHESLASMRESSAALESCLESKDRIVLALTRERDIALELWRESKARCAAHSSAVAVLSCHLEQLKDRAGHEGKQENGQQELLEVAPTSSQLSAGAAGRCLLSALKCALCLIGLLAALTLIVWLEPEPTMYQP